MTGWQALANAIVEQAARDYVSAVRLLKKDPESRIGMREAQDLEAFFHSAWYGILTDMDPDYLISRLREKAVS